MATTSTDLAKRDVKVGQYGLATIIENQLWKTDELQKVANVVFPVTALDALPPMHKPSVSVITVNADERSKDIYGVGSGQFGLAKAVILKMLNAGGASYRTEKLTPNSDLDNIRWVAQVWGKLPDGTFHSAQGSKAWSWIKCQEQMSASQAKMYRQFADEQTESKALMRAARAFLNIKTSYTKEELAKPFLIARSVPDIDTSDPEIKRMVAQKMIDSTFALYGEPAAAPSLPPPPITALPPMPTDEEFDEDDTDGGTYRPTEQVLGETPETEAEEDYNPFAEEEQMTESEVDAQLKQVAKSTANGGIGAEAFRDLLEQLGIARLVGVPLDIKIDILQKAQKVKERLK